MLTTWHLQDNSYSQGQTSNNQTIVPYFSLDCTCTGSWVKSIFRSSLCSEFKVKISEIAICFTLNVKLKHFPSRSFTFHLAILLNEHSTSIQPAMMPKYGQK